MTSMNGPNSCETLDQVLAGRWHMIAVSQIFSHAARLRAVGIISITGIGNMQVALVACPCHARGRGHLVPFFAGQLMPSIVIADA
jgi:hypothetical protein